MSESCSVTSDSLWPHGLYSPWDSLGQNTGVGSLSFLQGIFPTQGLNPGLLHCGQILYQLSHKGSSRILEWVAYPFSSRSSWPRNRTRVSCIAGSFFTNWTIRETLVLMKIFLNQIAFKLLTSKWKGCLRYRSSIYSVTLHSSLPPTETPVLWPPHAKSWLIGKDPDAGRDWGQEEKGTTEDEMAGWYHRLDGHESE